MVEEIPSKDAKIIEENIKNSIPLEFKEDKEKDSKA
jgi:hypothetical protein